MSDRTLLLGIDTSREGDLALAELHADGSLVLLAKQEFAARHQSSELLPRLDQLLKEAGVTLHQLAAIIIVNGPGSFTGLRIGISAAKGLAHAAGIPVLAVSSLAVLAATQTCPTVAVLVAGRTEYYVRKPATGHSPETETLETEEALPVASVNATVTVVHARLAAKLGATLAQSGAFEAIRTVLPRFHAGAFDDLASLDANYVRRPYTEKAAAPASSNEKAHGH